VRRREAGEPRVVLVADSDRASRRTITRPLTRIGCQAEEAQTGREALETADRIRPRLVLAEVNLPEVSGHEVCHELRHRYGDDVAVIFLSADRTEPYDRVGGLLLGAVDYIVKPFDERELLARVRSALRRPPTGGTSRDRGTANGPWSSLNRARA
jgi:DNA-binding response OmpR family regulator